MGIWRFHWQLCHGQQIRVQEIWILCLSWYWHMWEEEWLSSEERMWRSDQNQEIHREGGRRPNPCPVSRKEELREKSLYGPLDLNLKSDYNLQFRGESINFVNCHIQDISENSADLKHFYYVHTYTFSWLKWVTFKWSLRWTTASDPNLEECMKLQDPYMNDFRKKLFKKVITPKNRQYLSILSMENSWVIFWTRGEIFYSNRFPIGTRFGLSFPQIKIIWSNSPTRHGSSW